MDIEMQYFSIVVEQHFQPIQQSSFCADHKRIFKGFLWIFVILCLVVSISWIILNFEDESNFGISEIVPNTTIHPPGDFEIVPNTTIRPEATTLSTISTTKIVKWNPI